MSVAPWPYYASRPPDEIDEADWVDVYAPDGSLVRIEGPVFAVTGWIEDGGPTWLLHEQSWTVTPSGEHVEVDSGIVPVLQSIWRKGLKTLYSCEGTRQDPAYIMFATDADQSRFVAFLGDIPHKAANNRAVYFDLQHVVDALLRRGDAL